MIHHLKKNKFRSNPFKPNRIFCIKEAIKVVMFFVLLVNTAQGILAQQAQQTEWVEIVKADSLFVIQQSETFELIGNVVMKHKGALLYCNRAVQNKVTNMVEAFGNVRILQGDTVSVTGDTLLYFGNTRLAIISGAKTTMKDKERTLTSRKLEYDMAGGIAYYRQRGRTVDKENVLTSEEGFYNTQTKEYNYYRNVKLVNKKYTLTTDTLFYNSITKWSDFKGKATRLEGKDGTLAGTKGRYNSTTGESVFDQRTMIENPSYTLTGDSLNYDERIKRGFARGNVVIYAKKDNTILHGDEGWHLDKEGMSKIYGHALVKRVVSGDTLYIRGDTLYSIENKVDSTRKLIGNRNVYLFKSDFQGRCDSVSYNTADSVIHFYKKPILWSKNYQMEADSISAYMVQNRMDRMLLRSKAFIISEDSLVKQYNQIKGRTINAYFEEENNIKKVLVEGNGESIYYAQDEDLKLLGLNRVLCGKMNIFFKEGKVYRIAFIGKPDGKLIPPHEITPSARQLDGFAWRLGDKPDLNITTWKVPPQ